MGVIALLVASVPPSRCVCQRYAPLVDSALPTPHGRAAHLPMGIALHSALYAVRLLLYLRPSSLEAHLMLLWLRSRSGRLQ